MMKQRDGKRFFSFPQTIFILCHSSIILSIAQTPKRKASHKSSLFFLKMRGVLERSSNLVFEENAGRGSVERGFGLAQQEHLELHK